MFERFTDGARRVVVLAQEEARRLDHNYIGTEHILLGLLHEREGTAARVLAGAGAGPGASVDLEAVRAHVAEEVGRGEVAPAGHIPFTPRAKHALELALREAIKLGHNYVGTEHVLLGVLAEGEGLAVRSLAALGVDVGRLGDEVRRQAADRSVTSTVVRASRPPGEPPVRVTLGPSSVAPGPLGRSAAVPVFRRFTLTASRLLLLAESEAWRAGHPVPGVEHLLLGMLLEGECAAARALAAVGLDLATARRAFDGPAVTPWPTAPGSAYRDDLLDAAERALHVAFLAGVERIDAEHLLLGVVHQAESRPGVAAQALDLVATTPEAVREALAPPAA